MPASLLDSQCAALEPPAEAIVLDVALSLDEIVDRATQALARE
jgi:gluconate kinase